MKKQIIWLSILIVISPAFSAHAGDISVHGFVQGNYSLNATSQNPDGSDFKYAEERLQLKLDASEDPFKLFFKGDLFYDNVYKSAQMELREGYIDYTSKKWDVKIGRQIVTWGIGDLVFINDIFPKDYQAFFSGRPLEYLKKGVDGAKLSFYPEIASFEFVIIPFFEPNNYPEPKRFYQFDPMPAVTNRERKKPPASFGNSEVALRVYRDIGGFDTSIYLYRGYFRRPYLIADNLFNPAKITLYYPKLSVYGFSSQGKGLDGIISFEGGYYDSRQDRGGTGYAVPNSQTRLIAGYQKELWEDFTVGIQYYTEYMHKYFEYKQNLPEGFPKDKRFYQLASLRLTQFLKHQTLKFSFFAFYSVSDKDYQLNPEVRYSFTDSIWGALGGNIFSGGKKWSQFGQLSKNDNVYVQLRYEF